MSQPTAQDLRWLDAAVRYATPFAGTTADNPSIAALVVDPNSQTLLAKAVTAKGGRPHAEAQAVAAAGFDAAGCTLYVTLTPCSHWGRSPPCADAIIRAGIMRVVIGTDDPDPRNAGKTAAYLESAGVEVILANHLPSQQLHAGHALRHSADRPFVTAVVLTTAEGQSMSLQDLSTEAGASIQRWMDAQCATADAVMIGAGTARLDDPALVVSLPGMADRTPLRVVLAGEKDIDRKVNLIGGFSGHRTAIIAESASRIDAPVSVEVIRVSGKAKRPDFAAALRALASKGIQNLLVQPGKGLMAGMLDAGYPDRFIVVTTPVSKAASDGVSELPIAEALLAAGLQKQRQEVLGLSELTIYERLAPSE